MSKYIIEIEEKPLCVFDKDTQTYFPRLWRVKGFNSLVFDEEGLSRLEELNSDYINEHFGDLQDEAYKRGFEDGKAVNDKGCEGCKYEGGTVERNPCFTCCNYYQNYWTAKKQEDKILIGDVVKLHENGDNCIVTALNIDDDDDMCVLMTRNGGFMRAYTDALHKTGKHFDLVGMLKEMDG